jgi:hypothetical protein
LHALRLPLRHRLDLVNLDGLPWTALQRRNLPGLRGGVEARLGNGAFEVGYTYWAGSMHFEALQRVRTAGLKLQRTEPDGLEIDLRGRHWSFSVDRPAQERFAVLAGAFVNKKRIGQLDFGRFGVGSRKWDERRRCWSPTLTCSWRRVISVICAALRPH